MKRAVIVLAAGLLLVASLSSFAQEKKTYPQTAYYKAVPIAKIWMHPLGYVVRYFTSASVMATAYVPFTWFNQGIESKADIIYGQGPGYPYMVIYWVDGKFDRILLYVEENTSALSWGMTSESANLDSQFNVQGPPLQF